jgi:pimeloyl-ACP methyl ester carboxylesterase
VSEFTVDGLSGEEAGEGIPVVLLHGLTATRRYVVMGSRTLERSGHRVVSYDARGHGRSEPGEYGYPALADDLLAVLDDRGIDRAVLAGASMGAHTIVRLALDHGDRVAGVVLITPGVEGFVAAYGDPGVPDAWRDTVTKVVRQRLSAHEHPEAVADALRAVPRSRAFEDWSELGELALPALVVASRDDADPGHPYAVGERYAREIPGAELVSEHPGASPLAWQGGQLSKLIAALAARAAG